MAEFQCEIRGEAQIYDGDTIKDVKLQVTIPELEVGFYLSRDIRVNGIDTPEKRPRKKGRTPEGIKREKAAAAEARLVFYPVSNFGYSLFS